MPDDKPRIVRPWAGRGDNWEMILPVPLDVELPDPASPEGLATVFRYVQNRFGGLAQGIDDDGRLHPCAKPDCGRLVSAMSSFCCAPCADANAGLYELAPHEPGTARDPYSMHTASCEDRHRVRGPWRDPDPPPDQVAAARRYMTGRLDAAAALDRWRDHLTAAELDRWRARGAADAADARAQAEALGIDPATVAAPLIDPDAAAGAAVAAYLEGWG